MTHKPRFGVVLLFLGPRLHRRGLVKRRADAVPHALPLPSQLGSHSLGENPTSAFFLMCRLRPKEASFPSRLSLFFLFSGSRPSWGPHPGSESLLPQRGRARRTRERRPSEYASQPRPSPARTSLSWTLVQMRRRRSSEMALLFPDEESECWAFFGGKRAFLRRSSGEALVRGKS